MSLEQDIKALERAFEALLEHVHDEETRWACYCVLRYMHDWTSGFVWLASTKECGNEFCSRGYVPGKLRHTKRLCPVCKGKGRMKKGKKGAKL